MLCILTRLATEIVSLILVSAPFNSTVSPILGIWGNTSLLSVNFVAVGKRICNEILKIALKFKHLFGSKS